MDLPPLEAGANVYSSLRIYIRDQVFRGKSTELSVNLAVDIGLLAVSFAVCLATLIGLLGLKGNERVWLLRRKATSRGVLYTPTCSLLYTAFQTGCALSAMLFLIGRYRSASVDASSVMWSAAQGPLMLCIILAVWWEGYGMQMAVFVESCDLPCRSAIIARLYSAAVLNGLGVAVLLVNLW